MPLQWSPGIDWWLVIILLAVLCAMTAIFVVNFRYKLALGDVLLLPGFIIVNLLWILPFYLGASPNYFTIFAPRIAQAALADTHLPCAAGTPPTISWSTAIAALRGRPVTIDGWQPLALVEGYNAWYANGYAPHQAPAAWHHLIQSQAMQGLAATWIAQMPAQTAPGTQYGATAAK